MGKLTFQAALGGTVDLVGPNTAGAVTLNLPTSSGDLVGTGSTGVITTGMISGQIAVAQGGTNSSTAQAAINTLVGGTLVSGQYLRSNGTNALMAAIQAADVPTLNQNTTGTAAGLSSILAVAYGGTGTSSPGLVAGTNVTITGTWPNQTINSSGGGSGMVYPGAGIPLSTGSAWGSSYSTTGSGNVVLNSEPSLAFPKIDSIQASTSTGVTTILGFTNNAGTANGPYLNVTNATPSSNNPIVLSVTNAGVFVPNLELQAAPNAGAYVAVNNGVTPSIKLRFNPTGTASTTTTLTSTQTANRTLNLPDADDTLVGKATTDTLTNKTINGSNNTITNVSLTSGVTGTLPVANGGTGVTTSTGTGSVVLSTSPTLITPLLGTPTSGNFSTGTFTWPTFNQNTTGTAANVTGTVAIGNGGTGQTTASAAFNALSPITTAGDLILGNGTNSATRLAIGTNGYVLTSNGTTASWAAASSGSGTVTSITAGTGLTGGTITTSGTIALATTAVTAASYTSANITVDAYGRITAAANGSGGGGGLSWQAVQTADFTATSGNAYPVNTTSGAITVTLPASPTAGNLITIVDYAGTAGTNNININPNGNKIEGSTNSQSININRQAYNFIYVDATQGWISYAQQYSAITLSYSISYLVVAGGGGGGAGGAGGAGGLLYSSSALITSGNSYTVTVGAGGSGTASSGAYGTNGVNSSFSFIGTAALGGGGGSSWNSTANNGLSGGSGGGSGASDSGGGGTGGAGTSGQGTNGGNGYPGGGVNAGGGGGGAGAAAGNASSGVGGNGGIGSSLSISGSATYYAGGGGGGASLSGTAAGTGGSGGGGAGGLRATGTNGTANTGGGGGAGGFNGAFLLGGTGGSGIVIISYPGSQRGTGGTVTSVGGYTIHTFTTSGTYVS